MKSSLTNPPSGVQTLYPFNDELEQSFAENGYLLFPGIVDKPALAELRERILAEFERARGDGRLFAGGGSISGHLNCFPGVGSRFVYDDLRTRGILDVVRRLSPTPLRDPNIGCNLNLPGSSQQNDHADGYASQPFLIVNVAAVDTTLSNGAMEVLTGTHRQDHKYWRLMLGRPTRIRLCMKQGDVLVRTSALWHRGMPNMSQEPRPMLALTWEDGGSLLADPYQANGGKISFFPNRYATDWAGRLRERAFVAAPRLGKAFRVVRSLLDG